MNDLISRQAAIRAIKDLPACQNGYSNTYDKAQIIGVLEELPSAQPDGDLISRQAVNGIIDALFQNKNNTIIASPIVWSAFREIQNLPSSNTHNALEVPSSNTPNALEALEMRWIPCSERLPELFEPVLGTFKFQGGNGCLTTERIVLNGEERWTASCGMTPIAWMPLPEPYKDGEDA